MYLTWKTDNTAEGIKEIVDDTYKGYEGQRRWHTKSWNSRRKIIQNIEVDMTVASLNELKKQCQTNILVLEAVSFAASKMLKEAGYTEQTN